MSDLAYALADRLAERHWLTLEGYQTLLEQADGQVAAHLAALARKERERWYGDAVYIRGLIEISNICKNDCYYCGIRRSNRSCRRYRLTPQEILACCREGYALGFRTFVLQGGEDAAFTDEVLESLIANIKQHWPDCAVTLSLGERSEESYARLRKAGADRYLLRHETVDPVHYGLLHPGEMSWQHRMDCLRSLRKQGYQVGCGFMVGTPGQTVEMLARELKFVEEFKPEMCGIGPFIPHRDTVFAGQSPGTVEMTCLLLSCIRLIHPAVLLPATTALGSLRPDGREAGMLAGANVVMPNLSPESAREKYMLYNNKLSGGAESAQARELLEQKMASIGYRVVTHRGDAADDSSLCGARNV